MELAINAIKQNKIGFLKASKIFNVPKSTLRRHSKEQNILGNGGHKHLGRHVDLPSDIEKQLVQHILELESRFYGLTPLDLRRLLAWCLMDRCCI